MLDKKHAAFSGRLVIVGFGSIGQGVLPLLLRHIDIGPEQITIVTAEPRGQRGRRRALASTSSSTPLTRENYRDVLTPLLGAGDFLLNVSVDVSSLALIELCQEKGALYLDTCIEPWPGGYTDPKLPPSPRSNYALRESALALRRQYAERPDRGPDARRQSRPRLAFRQAGAARHRARRRPGGRDPGRPRRLGAGSPSGSASRSSTSPSATPRSRAIAEAAGRVRQHLVDRRLCQRRLAAGRARLGHA